MHTNLGHNPCLSFDLVLKFSPLLHLFVQTLRLHTQSMQLLLHVDTLVCKQTPTSLTVSETHLETVKHLCGIACTELQFEQFLVFLLTTLVELLVLNLELIKVHLMTDLASLLLLHTRQEATITYTCWYWSSSYQNTYLFQLGLQLFLLDTKSRVL